MLGEPQGRRSCVSMLAEYPRSASYVAVTILSRCAREQVSRPTSSLAPVAALKFSTMTCYRRSVEPRSLGVKRPLFRGNGQLDRHSDLRRTFVPLRTLFINVPTTGCLDLHPGSLVRRLEQLFSALTDVLAVDIRCVLRNSFWSRPLKPERQSKEPE